MPIIDLPQGQVQHRLAGPDDMRCHAWCFCMG